MVAMVACICCVVAGVQLRSKLSIVLTFLDYKVYKFRKAKTRLIFCDGGSDIFLLR